MHVVKALASKLMEEAVPYKDQLSALAQAHSKRESPLTPTQGNGSRAEAVLRRQSSSKLRFPPLLKLRSQV